MKMQRSKHAALSCFFAFKAPLLCVLKTRKHHKPLPIEGEKAKQEAQIQ
jgi:hypothetical protein